MTDHALPVGCLHKFERSARRWPGWGSSRQPMAPARGRYCISEERPKPRPLPGVSQPRSAHAAAGSHPARGLVARSLRSTRAADTRYGARDARDHCGNRCGDFASSTVSANFCRIRADPHAPGGGTARSGFRPRSVRIMITLAAEAAGKRSSVRRLLEAGTDCVRINCAHDEPATMCKSGASTAGFPCRTNRIYSFRTVWPAEIKL
jgi:hypothetical protein